MLSPKNVGRTALFIAVQLASSFWPPLLLRAEDDTNHLGGQDRADAASRMIVLAVQQALSSLPPTSGQAFSYEFDPTKDTYLVSERLGPTAVRAPQTIGAGKLSIRLAASYFELADSFGPINYLSKSDDPAVGQEFVKFGLRAAANIGLLNLSTSYGVTGRLEMSLNIPLVTVSTAASQSFTTWPASVPDIPGKPPPVLGLGTIALLDQALADKALRVRTETFSDLGFKFNSGTHTGVGRISLGTKAALYSDRYFDFAFAPRLFFPSPSEGDFAGSASPGILPRGIAQVSLFPSFKLHVDTGYDYDFDNPELRRLLWNFGASITSKYVAVDLGLGGSNFDTRIHWTPAMARGVATEASPAATIIAQDRTTLSDTFVDVLAGLKVRVGDSSAISGAVSIPVNTGGFRPTAVGTVALESYF